MKRDLIYPFFIEYSLLANDPFLGHPSLVCDVEKE